MGVSKKKFTRGSRAVLWFVKGDNYKFDISRIYQPYKENSKKTRKYMEQGKMGTNLYDWWEINLCKNVSPDYVGYKNQLPQELLRRIIVFTTDQDDWVADPCAGSFSAIRVALNENRNAWGCDLDPETKKYWP